ncbi:MAG TPA: S46 family peptidase, partial [Chitinophagales bacterium]|nr:S46 family peptidase [Chitinophagales bacterium]
MIRSSSLVKVTLTIVSVQLFRLQVLRADPPVEGMWLPLLLDQLTIHDMQANGLQLSADDLYSVNHASMKDAVLLFGTGCTGEMVSEQGLVLTAHHCGLGQIQSHSSVEHDYLRNGFWAMNRSEELACPGLKVTFIISIADVTSRVVSVLPEGIPEWKRNLRIDSISKVIASESTSGTHYGAQVKPFYNGNQFFVFVTETFRDVRLVGAPPVSIGNFGGETDNWVWPRHTGDFAVFRIYAGADNKPADYAADNVPFRPRYYFPISLKGVKEQDFTMVYGFPGTTNEYATSYAIDLVQNVMDPDRVKIRGEILNTWWNDMLVNDTIRIQYLSKYNGLGNGWKKWQGESKGLREAGAIGQKELYEAEFSRRVEANSNWKQRYGMLLPQLKIVYDSLRQVQPLVDYFDEALNKPELFAFALSFQPLVETGRNKAATSEAIS